MKTKSHSKNGGFFGSLGRFSARHARSVILMWVVILAISGVLYLTMFSKNMTTVIKFTTQNDSQKAEDIFAEKFPLAAYDLESGLVSSNKYTADDPEFWAYVDGLWAKLGPLREVGAVKDAQYLDPALREGVPLVPPLLEKMVAAINLMLDNSTTSEQLIQASDGLKAAAVEMRAAASQFTDDKLTDGGKQGRDGMLQAAAGADELAGTCLLADGLQKTYNALYPVTQGTPLTAEVREATVAEMKATAARLSAMAAYLEATGPGTADRPTLVSGLKQFGEQGPMLAAMYEAKWAAQLGRDFAVMLTGSDLPSAADVIAVTADMQATGQRLTSIIAYVEANVPDSPTRQTLLDGLNSASSQMNMYGTTVMPILAQALSYIEDPGSGFWGDTAETFLRAALGLARGYIEPQIATAEDGLRQMQEQTGAQIGQVNDGIATLKGQLSMQLPTAVDGIAQAQAGIDLANGLISTDRQSCQFIVKMSPDKDEAASYVFDLRDAILTGTGKGVDPETTFEEDGFRVRMIGMSNTQQDMQDVALSDLKKSMIIAVPIALVVLFVVFGTLGAAVLPIVLALVVIVVALGVCAIVGTWIQIAFAIQNIVALLGLSLGIDHALFLAYRYREERRKGRDKIEAIAKANASAGHAIFWAGVVVIISFLGIMFIPCSMHQSLGVGAFTVLFVIIPASLTLLPALLSVLGNGFDFGRLPWQKRLTDPLPPETEGSKDIWHWITRPSLRAPIISFVLGTALLLLVIWPYTKMRLSYTSVESLPPDSVSRSGLDAIKQAGFPDYATMPVNIAIDGYDKPAVRAQAEELFAEMEASGQFYMNIPLFVNEEGTVAWKMSTFLQSPFTPEAADLIRDLRSDYIGDRFETAGGAAHVAGQTAFTVDFLKINEDYMDPILSMVLVLRFLLLMVAFRAILISVFLTVLSVLSLYAGYGMVVWVFQEGNTLGIYQKISGIDPYVPFMLMCGLLGISMDFLVFMASRVRERYDQNGGVVPEAVLHSFRRTGFVIMGVAAVMVVVFFAFSISKILTVSELGFGMAIAMVVDGTLVNFLMSPSVMKILGKWLWWWPSWLNWVPDWRSHPGDDEVAPEENVFGPYYRPSGVPGYAAADSAEDGSAQPHWRS